VEVLTGDQPDKARETVEVLETIERDDLGKEDHRRHDADPWDGDQDLHPGPIALLLRQSADLPGDLCDSGAKTGEFFEQRMESKSSALVLEGEVSPASGCTRQTSTAR